MIVSKDSDTALNSLMEEVLKADIQAGKPHMVERSRFHDCNQ